MISTTMLGKAVSLTDRSISHNIADGGVMQLKYYFQTTTASNGIYIYWITNREYTERANEEEKPKEQTKKEKPQKEKDERVIKIIQDHLSQLEDSPKIPDEEEDSKTILSMKIPSRKPPKVDLSQDESRHPTEKDHQQSIRNNNDFIFDEGHPSQQYSIKEIS